MNQVNSKSEAIKVCQGPGCKAWGAKSVLRSLRNFMQANGWEGRRVCTTPCMNRCGGGTSIEVEGGRRCVKVKETSEALNVLCTSPALF